MKKKLIVLLSALFAFEGLVAMDNVENANENSLQRPKITSLSGGMEILPGMRSEKLYFKPIIYPREWDQYKELPQMKRLNKYLLKVANTGTDNPEELFNIMTEISENISSELLYEEIGGQYADYFYKVIDTLIYARILELGGWKARFVTLGFVSHYKSHLEPLTNYIIYSERPVTPSMLVISGLYIDLLYPSMAHSGGDLFEFRRNSEGIYDEFPQMISEMLSEIKDGPLPSSNYFSWSLEKASNNLEAQEQWVSNSLWNQ